MGGRYGRALRAFFPAGAARRAGVPLSHSVRVRGSPSSRMATGSLRMRSGSRTGRARSAYGATLYWIALALAIYTKLAFLGYAAAVLLVLAPVVGLGGVFLFEIRRRTNFPLAILLPVAWVTVEMLLMHISDLSFPWLPLGLSLARTPVLAQPAELVGVHGLSLWLAATSGLLADAWLARRRWQAVAGRVGAALALVAAVWVYGNWRMANIALKSVARIAIVQPNVPQEDKWQEQNQGRILGMLLDLTRQAVAPHADSGGSAATRALARGVAAGIPAATSRMGNGRRNGEHAEPHTDHLRRARSEFPGARADGLFQRRDALRHRGLDPLAAAVPQELPRADRGARAVPGSALVPQAALLRRIRPRRASAAVHAPVREGRRAHLL